MCIFNRLLFLILSGLLFFGPASYGRADEPLKLDVVGLTTYPSPFHASPAKLPLDYYFWIYHHIKNTDEVLLMEVGWPTSGSGNEHEQQAFIRRLPELLSRVNVSVIAWALLLDVGLAEFDANLNTVGLVTNNGQRNDRI